jgi:predicted NBD/HSP70 family sugar kinase
VAQSRMGGAMTASGAKTQRTLPTHGASELPSVHVDAYNCELEDEDGFVGDKANRVAFRNILNRVRKALRTSGEDPLGKKHSEDISKKKLDLLLAEGEPEAAAVIQSAIEDFARQLASVVDRFLRIKAWRGTKCIVLGGGFRASRVGELAIARAAILLKEDGVNIDLHPIHHDPDEAGLLGAAHLLPAWMLDGHDAILAADVGGSNIRAGIVDLNLEKERDLSKACVLDMKLWRHKDHNVERDEAVARLIHMVGNLIKAAKKRDLNLAPVLGIACPGVIAEDGSITRGAQNLPGNWESSKFNLPAAIREELPRIGQHETLVVMHNDAVVQGLSELPHLEDCQHWGVLTIGTGLGNARFTRKATITKR